MSYNVLIVESNGVEVWVLERGMWEVELIWEAWWVGGMGDLGG